MCLSLFNDDTRSVGHNMCLSLFNDDTRSVGTTCVYPYLMMIPAV